VLGLGFRGDLFFFFDNSSMLWARLLVMLNVLTFQFSPIVLVVMLGGLLVLFKTDRALALLLGASIALHTFVSAVYRAPQTVEYMLPAYVLLAGSFGYAGGYLRRIRSSPLEGSFQKRALNAVAILILTGMTLLVLTQTAHNYGSFRALSSLTRARDYAQPLLQDAPPDALILADWHWATPLWYLQEVEGLREDVGVRFVFPESNLYADTWAGQIAAELSSGIPVIATHFDSAAYGQLPPAEPFHGAFLYRPDPLLRLPDGYAAMSVELGSGIVAEGLYLMSEETSPGQELVVQMAWLGDEQIEPGRTLYAHLIGPDGRLYAGDDQLAQPNHEGLTINRFGLTPLLQTPPGSYAIVIGSYNATVENTVTAAPVAEIEVRAPSTPPVTTNAVFRPLADGQDGKTLIGYDWDSTLPGQQRLYLHWSIDGSYETQSVDVDGGRYGMPDWFGPWGLIIAGTAFELDRPSAYVPLGQGLVWLGQSRDEERSFSPGARVRLSQDFTTARPVLSDQVVSLRLVGYQEDGRSWAWWDLDDGVPAMGAIPTLKWIAGSRVRQPVYSTISPDARPGQQSEPLLLLYDAFTSRQLPILDERITQLAPWIPLGRIPILPGP